MMMIELEILVKEYLNQNNYLVSTAKDSNDALKKLKLLNLI